MTVWDVDEPRELEPGQSGGVGPGDEASRLVLHGDPAVTAQLLPELRAEWSGRLRVAPIRPGFLGVFAPEVDKADALRLVAARLGVPLERTAACGDGRADKALLAAAAVRIAVGGRPHVLGHLPDVVVTDWARLPGDAPRPGPAAALTAPPSAAPYTQLPVPAPPPWPRAAAAELALRLRTHEGRRGCRPARPLGDTGRHP